MTEPDAPPTDEELAESQRLREALEDPSKPHEDAELLRAVKHASVPTPPRELEAAVESALRTRRKPAVVVWVAFGAGALAAAAALLLWRPAPAPHLVVVRSTQPLFSNQFASAGGESARIDRIALARAADLRENEFARWGVRR